MPGTTIMRPNADQTTPAGWATVSTGTPYSDQINEVTENTANYVGHRQSGLTTIPTLVMGLPDLSVPSGEFMSSITVSAWYYILSQDARNFHGTLSVVSPLPFVLASGSLTLDFTPSVSNITHAFLTTTGYFSAGNKPTATQINDAQMTVSGYSTDPANPSGDPNKEFRVFQAWAEFTTSLIPNKFNMVV